MHIQKLIGHNSSKTTDRYTQVSIQEIGKIVNPLATYYIENSGTILIKNGNIEPLDNGDDKNKYHKGGYYTIVSHH